ncbi:tol-pal system protein YbgF [Parendozoicomonas haliclonae]|uniref:Cell division coordinator CpoB n=1 Tax=Parendozoicomonas haliclonae TaxID=1960125 RepID=A0A1X7AFK4_9GAMM|nr:tol-pal system protein YbgF [Parendozoicomonas haliclonae]SMA36492.1 tol-pal system protein YbgF [Parendozoicomonas haliclonae]
MVARSALLGLALSALAVNAVAASSIPVVNAGAEAPAAGSATQPVVNTVTTTPVQPVQTQGGEAALLLNQIDTLQREIMELRGVVEEQTNAIARIQNENRDRYLDLDRRISQLVAGGAVASLPQTQPTADTAAQPAGNNVPAQAQTGAQVNGDTLYQDSFQLIRERRFDEALAGLQKYLTEYPEGTFVDNAQYWLGEVHLAQGKLKEAEADFSTLISKYPFSDKLADATYKLGQVYDRLGDRAKAKEYLQRAVKDFPNSSAARLADVYLSKLEG